MDELEFERFLDELRKDADQATWFIGFLKAIVDNDKLPERVNNSFSGYAFVTARAGVKNTVILYCARAWDQDKDTISVRRARADLPPLEVLEERRRIRIEALGGVRPVEPLDARYEKFVKNFEKVRDRDYHPSIRMLRTEHFAHRLLKSRERAKLEGDNIVILDATYNDLLELAEDTTSLVGQVGYLWDGLANPYPDRVARATKYSREFLRIVPVLKDAERLED